MSRKKQTQHFFSQSPCIKSFQSGKFCNIFKNLLPSTNLNWVQNTKKWLETWKASKWAMGTSGSFKIVLASYINSQTYGCSKSTESEILSLSSKLCVVKKNRYTLKKRFWAKSSWFFLGDIYIYFFYAALIIWTNSKFQTPLTLRSHNKIIA